MPLSQHQQSKLPTSLAEIQGAVGAAYSPSAGAARALGLPARRTDKLHELSIARTKFLTNSSAKAFEFLPLGFDESGLFVGYDWDVEFHRIHGLPILIDIPTATNPASPEETATAFIESWGAIWNLDLPAFEVVHVRTTSGVSGNKHVVFRQLLNGVPIARTKFCVHLSSSGLVLGVTSSVCTLCVDFISPAVAESVYFESIQADYGDDFIVGPPLLMYFVPRLFGLHGETPFLAWAVLLREKTGFGTRILFHDANTREALFAMSSTLQHKQLSIFSDPLPIEVGFVDHDNEPIVAPGLTAICTQDNVATCGPLQDEAVAATQISAQFFQTLESHFGEGFQGNTSELVFQPRLVLNSPAPAGCGAHGNFRTTDYFFWKELESVAVEIAPGGLGDYTVAHELGHLVTALHGYSSPKNTEARNVDEHWADVAAIWHKQALPETYANPYLQVGSESSFSSLGTDDDGAQCSATLLGRADDPPALNEPDSLRWYESIATSHQNRNILSKMYFLLDSEGRDESAIKFMGVALTGVPRATLRRMFFDAAAGELMGPAETFSSYRDALVGAATQLSPDLLDGDEIELTAVLRELERAWNAVGLWSPWEFISPAEHNVWQQRVAMANFRALDGSPRLVGVSVRSPFSPGVEAGEIQLMTCDLQDRSWTGGETLSLGFGATTVSTRWGVAATRVSEDELAVFFIPEGTSSLAYVLVSADQTVSPPTFVPLPFPIGVGLGATTTQDGEILLFVVNVGQTINGEGGVPQLLRHQGPFGFFESPWIIESGPFGMCNTAPDIVSASVGLDGTLTPFAAGGAGIRAAAVATQFDGSVGFAFLTNDGQWVDNYGNPGPVPIPNGNREYAAGNSDPWIWQLRSRASAGLAAPAPTIARNGSGFLVAVSDAGAVYTQALAVPRFESAFREWGPVQRMGMPGRYPSLIESPHGGEFSEMVLVTQYAYFLSSLPNLPSPVFSAWMQTSRGTGTDGFPVLPDELP